MKSSSSDLRAQVGQLLIFGFDGTEFSPELCNRLSMFQPGGIILFKRNIVAPDQTHALLKESQRTVETPMFLCVDMEGGTVDRLKDVIAPVPAVSQVAGTRVKKLFREHGRLLGEEVRALGFNVDFAPCVDLAFEASRSVLGTRTVSATQAETVVYAREMLRGLKDSHVLGCGKHFPGLGEANLDSHHDMPVIDKPWKKLWEEDLAPYRRLRAQMPFVMVAHAAYPAVTKQKTPASLSKKWITDILRRKIGYRGLIISDDLEMGGVLSAAPIEEAAVETVRAGADIYLICHNDEFVNRSFEAVLHEAERDRRFREIVQKAAKRILTYKKRSPELKRRMSAVPNEKIISKLRRKNWMFTEEVRLATNRMMAM
jgi:beta-N-acetylhexosaminidase